MGWMLLCCFCVDSCGLLACTGFICEVTRLKGIDYSLLPYDSRGASFKEDDGTWKGNDDGKVVNNQPQRVMDERNGIGPQAGYIGR